MSGFSGLAASVSFRQAFSTSEILCLLRYASTSACANVHIYIYITYIHTYIHRHMHRYIHTYLYRRGGALAARSAAFLARIARLRRAPREAARDELDDQLHCLRHRHAHLRTRVALADCNCSIRPQTSATSAYVSIRQCTCEYQSHSRIVTAVSAFCVSICTFVPVKQVN